MGSVITAQDADFDKASMRIIVDAQEEDIGEYKDETTDARTQTFEPLAAIYQFCERIMTGQKKYTVR